MLPGSVFWLILGTAQQSIQGHVNTKQLTMVSGLHEVGEDEESNDGNITINKVGPSMVFKNHLECNSPNKLPSTHTIQVFIEERRKIGR